MGPFLVVAIEYALHSKGQEVEASRPLSALNSRDRLTGEVNIAQFKTIEEASEYAFESTHRAQTDPVDPQGGSLAGVSIVQIFTDIRRLPGEPVSLTERFAIALARAASPGQILTCIDSHRAVCATKLRLFGSKPLGQHVIMEDYAVCEVYQLEHKSYPTVYPAIASIRPILNNLGSRFASFFGRESDLSAVASLLQETRIVTLTGEPGIGKSSLAWRVALDYCDDLHGGVWRVTCQDDSKCEDLLEDLATDLQRRTENRLPYQEAIKSAFTYDSGLVIFDRCDRALKSVKEAIEWLLGECPMLSILSTARQPFGLSGEGVYRLGPLECPTQSQVDTFAQLIGFDGPRLFVDRIQQLEATWQPVPEDIKAIVDLCNAAHGHPATLIAFATEAAIQGIVKIKEAVLASQLAETPSKHLHQSQIWKPIEQAYQRLSGEAQNLAHALLAMYSHCSLDEAVDLIEADRSVVQESLAELSHAGFLDMAMAEEGDFYYSLSEQFVSYLRARMTPSQRVDGENAHLRFCLRIASVANDAYQRADLPTAMEIWKEAYSNIRLALGRAMASQNPEALPLFTKVGNYMMLARPNAESVEIATRVCALCVHKASIDGTTALIITGGLLIHMQSFEKADECYKRAYQMAETLQDSLRMAVAKANLMITNRFIGDMQEAVKAGEEAVRWFRDAGDKVKLARTLANLGALLEDLNEPDRSIECNEEAYELAVELGDDGLACNVLGNLANLQQHLGNYYPAISLYGRSIAIISSQNMAYAMNIYVEGICICAAALGKWSEAIRFSATADHLRETSGIVRAPDQELEIEKAFQPYVDQWGSETLESQRESSQVLSVEEISSWCLLTRS